MQGCFELILDQSQTQKRVNLGSLLSSKLGFEIHEIESILQHPSFVLLRANTREALEPLRRELDVAGAKVSIVQSNDQFLEFDSFHKLYISGLTKVLNHLSPNQIGKLASDIESVNQKGGRILIIGNGGSAANASHLANDLNKRRSSDPTKFLKALSLTDNSAWMTAIANDCGYDEVFIQQLQSILEPRDILIAISSSGNSPSILKAVEYANNRGALTFGIVGFGGGKLLKLAQRCINIPTNVGEYGYMEDATLAIGHLLTTYFAAKDL